MLLDAAFGLRGEVLGVLDALKEDASGGFSLVHDVLIVRHAGIPSHSGNNLDRDQEFRRRAFFQQPAWPLAKTAFSHAYRPQCRPLSGPGISNGSKLELIETRFLAEEQASALP